MKLIVLRAVVLLLAFGWLVSAATIAMSWSLGLPMPWWSAVNGCLACAIAIISAFEALWDGR